MRSPDLDSVSLPTDDWEEEGRAATEIRWASPTGTFLSLHFFPRPPDLQAPLCDIDVLRAATRDSLAEMGGGLVQVERIDVQGLEALQQILKFFTENGMAYIGSITLPFRDFSFVIKAQCIESAPTGMRESMVADQLMQETGEAPDELLKRFHADPYEPSYQAPVRPSLRALSDDEAYDAVVPHHPLTQVRSCLAQARENARLGVELFSAPPFDPS